MNNEKLYDFYLLIDRIKLKLNIMQIQLIKTNDLDRIKLPIKQLEQQLDDILNNYDNSLFMSDNIKEILNQYHDPGQVKTIRFIIEQLSCENTKKKLIYHIGKLNEDERKTILKWYKDYVINEIKNDKDIVLNLIQDEHIKQYKEQEKQFSIDNFLNMIMDMDEMMKKRYNQHKKRIQLLFMKKYCNLIK